MNVREACEEYLQGDHDGGLLLSIISDSFSQEDPSVVANTLSQPHYELILKENGWDLLTLFTCYLKSTDSPVYLLIDHIIKICSPKEMYLALLEQFEILDDINTFILLLPLLGNVLQCIPNWTGYFIELQVFVKRYGQSFKKIALTEIAVTYKLEPLQSVDDDENEFYNHQDITWQHFVDTILILLCPFVKQLDHTYKQTSGNIEDTLSNTILRQQLEIITLLMELLDTVLTSSSDDPRILQIMEYIISCHYGGLSLLEWRNRERREENDENIVMSQNGLASFAYLLLTQCSSYLPAIIQPQYLLQVTLPHVSYSLTEFSMSHDRLSINGLLLLERLLEDISRHSLSSCLLEDPVMSDVAVTLCHSMYRCPFDQVRKCSYDILLKFIASFTSNGRYLLYKKLFHEMDHSGIQGLLIHQLKDEIDTVIKSDDCQSVFLGESLFDLYRHFLIATPQMDVLTEYDRLLGGLNFIRYLLLKDEVSINKTFIWTSYQQLKSDFLNPLRLAVFNLQGYCKTKLQSPTECDTSADSAIEVDVSVIGKGQIPELSPEEEVQTLQYSLHKLDIILSILARVEELAYI